MIRVAQVIGKCSEGGVESTIMNLYRNIDHSEVIFDFFVENESLIVNKKEIESYGGSIKIVPRYSRIFAFRKTLIKYFTQTKYDIVHVNMNAQSFIAIGAAKKAGIKVRIAHSHTSSNKKEGMRHIIKSILRVFSKKNVTNYFACSEQAGKWLFGKTKNSVYVLNNGIDYNRFAFNDKKRKEVRNKLGINENEILIGHIGRFMKQKNHRFLIDTFGLISKQNSNYKLCLIGNGEYLPDIKKLVDKKHLNGNVIFVGSVSNVEDYYSAFDLFVLPSLYEGLPVVGIEAQCNGLKCMFSNEITKESKILDGTEFLKINSSKDWANKIVNCDKKRSTFIIIDKFNIQKVANLLLQKYKEIIENV